MMKKLKTVLKKSRFVRYIYGNVFYKCIINLYKTKFKKNCLLSYSVLPFKQKNKFLIHPNFVENYTLAETLKSLGYNVDVFNNIYNGKINYSKYDLIVGEGIPISNYYLGKRNDKTKVIYYATGAHPLVQNYRSLVSLLKFARLKGPFLINSGRVVNSNWIIAPSLANKIIILGNETTKQSFDLINMESEKEVLNPPFYATNIIDSFEKKDSNHYLWFGSYGFIHKDLNTIIDVFLNNPGYTLHICGRITDEKEFFSVYEDQLSKSKNIILHGYLSVDSKDFKELMEKCAFTILSSCSEGCSTSIATVMGNGGLIPIISKECGIDIHNGIYVNTADYESIETAVKTTSKYDKEKIMKESKENISYINEMFSIDEYKKQIRRIMKKFVVE